MIKFHSLILCQPIPLNVDEPTKQRHGTGSMKDEEECDTD